jgi:uncharacterized protein (TIGR01777 family)
MKTKPCKIILAGGSGFFGGALARYFLNIGWEPVILSRSPRQRSNGVREVGWDAQTLGPWQKELEGATALVNLTGRSVDCRYNRKNRKEILESRIMSTRVCGQAIRACSNPPSVWLNASTATIYKHTFGPAWDEEGEIGAATEAKDAFSIEVAQAWEREVELALTTRSRKVILRTAMGLGHARNSVFPMLRRLVRLGLGGTIGSGKQYVSWIHELDFCRAMHWLILHEEISGIVNVAAPKPVTNREMMAVLRQSLGIPFGLPALSVLLEPGAFLLRTETELIVKSRRVIPRRLLDSGFVFRFPNIREAFADLCQPAHHSERSCNPSRVSS